MKPFDLEKAKQGHPLITREGLPARLLCHDLNQAQTPLVAAYYYSKGGDETVELFTAEGKLCLQDETDHDLFLATTTHTRWALLGGIPSHRFIVGELCDSEEAAKIERERYNNIESLRIVELSWSELI